MMPLQILLQKPQPAHGADEEQHAAGIPAVPLQVLHGSRIRNGHGRERVGGPELPGVLHMPFIDGIRHVLIQQMLLEQIGNQDGQELPLFPVTIHTALGQSGQPSAVVVSGVEFAEKLNQAGAQGHPVGGQPSVPFGASLIGVPEQLFVFGGLIGLQAKLGERDALLNLAVAERGGAAGRPLSGSPGINGPGIWPHRPWKAPAWPSRLHRRHAPATRRDRCWKSGTGLRVAGKGLDVCGPNPVHGCAVLFRNGRFGRHDEGCVGHMALHSPYTTWCFFDVEKLI